MELKEFIKLSTIQIIEATQEIEKKYPNSTNAKIDSTNTNPKANVFGYREDVDRYSSPILSVDFDLAVNTTDENNSQIGGGIFVMSLSFGAQTKTNLTSNNFHKIKFSIPLNLSFNKSEDNQ